MFKQPADGSMSGFVEGNGFFLFLRNNFVFLFQTAHNTIHRIQEILFCHRIAIPSGSDQR